MINQKGSIPLLMLVVILALGAFYLYFSGTATRILESAIIQSTEKDTTNNPSAPAQITITKNGFVPSVVSVAKNQPVTFINKDSVSHQILIDSLGIEAETIAANETFTLSFDTAGNYSFNQPSYPEFKGIIKVE